MNKKELSLDEILSLSHITGQKLEIKLDDLSVTTTITELEKSIRYSDKHKKEFEKENDE